MITGHLPELFIALTVALLIFGPKRLPDIGSSLGKGIREFRQGVSQLDGESPSAVTVETAESSQVAPDSRESGPNY